MSNPDKESKWTVDLNPRFTMPFFFLRPKSKNTFALINKSNIFKGEEFKFNIANNE